MIKAKLWTGEGLKGKWDVTYKLDGVRALWDGTRWVSRNDKPLYNLPDRSLVQADDCEVYLGTFKDSIIATRTRDGVPVPVEAMYSLSPLDPRLFSHTWEDPPDYYMHTFMRLVRGTKGYEGLVLRQGDTWLKVKPKETYDVTVTGMLEGKGKHVGKLGALLTEKGKVGTGFTDEERKEFWTRDLTGTTIEVECMQLTPDGQFRHPTFVRERPDK